MSDDNLFYGPNEGYVLELYERYQHDPASGDPETRAFFETWQPSDGEVSVVATAPAATVAAGVDVLKVVGAARLARLIREYGHIAAHVDPLGREPLGDPELELSTH